MTGADVAGQVLVGHHPAAGERVGERKTLVRQLLVNRVGGPAEEFGDQVDIETTGAVERHCNRARQVGDDDLGLGRWCGQADLEAGDKWPTRVDTEPAELRVAGCGGRPANSSEGTPPLRVGGVQFDDVVAAVPVIEHRSDGVAQFDEGRQFSRLSASVMSDPPVDCGEPFEAAACDPDGARQNLRVGSGGGRVERREQGCVVERVGGSDGVEDSCDRLGHFALDVGATFEAPRHRT